MRMGEQRRRTIGEFPDTEGANMSSSAFVCRATDSKPPPVSAVMKHLFPMTRPSVRPSIRPSVRCRLFLDREAGFSSRRSRSSFRSPSSSSLTGWLAGWPPLPMMIKIKEVFARHPFGAVSWLESEMPASWTEITNAAASSLNGIISH